MASSWFKILLKESLPPNKSGPGIVAPFWVWASAVPTSGTPRKEIHEASDQGGAKSPQAPAAVTAGGSDAFVNDLIANNSTLNGPSMINLLKANGVTFVVEGKNGTTTQDAPKPAAGSTEAGGGKKEADAASANTPVLRARESWVFRSKFSESNASDDGIGPTRFRVVLLEEGLGNFRDGYYYTKEALKSAVTVFEGKKIYADHPSSFEEQTRPERSVKDVLGHFENMAFVERDGRGFLEGDLVVMADKPFEWARALLRHAVEYQKKHPDKEFVGLSINANGAAEAKPIEEFVKEANIPESCMTKLLSARDKGLDNVKVVRAINEAVSCDMVTEAGAGGKVTSILESKSGKGDVALDNTKENTMGTKKLTEGDKQVEAAPVADDKKPAPAAAKDDKGGDDAGDDASDGDKGGDDEQQDKKLIQEMLDKHLGKEEHSEETIGQAAEAHKAMCAEGMDAKEAYESVGHAMKCARVMKKNQEAKEAAAKEAAAAADKSKDAPAPKESKAMESSIIALKAENSALKEKLAKIELNTHIDSKLAESKLPRTATKAFLESAGTIKNKEDFEQKFNVFVKAREAANSEVDGLSWVNMEKTPTVESGEALNLSDCVK